MSEQDCTARALFADAAAALAARTTFDELLVDALAAPDMGCLEAGRIVAYVGDGHLERGTAALARLRAALPQKAQEPS